MIVGVTISLTPEDVSRIEREAILHGFVRTDARKTWTDRERKELVRWYVHKLLGKAGR